MLCLTYLNEDVAVSEKLYGLAFNGGGTRRDGEGEGRKREGGRRVLSVRQAIDQSTPTAVPGFAPA